MPGGDLREASRDARVGRETERDLVAVQPAVDRRKVPAVRPDVLLAHADVRLPMFSYVANYAFTADLEFSPDADEVPRFYAARWR